MMGYRREGVWLRDGQLTLRRQRGIYLHSICVFHPDLCLTANQSPWAANVDRTNLTFAFPGRVKLTVRSVPWRDAQKCFEFFRNSSQALTRQLPPEGELFRGLWMFSKRSLSL